MTLFKNKYRIESIRLQTWDYSSRGYYFITICVKNRIHALGYVNNGKMILSKQGQIVQEQWNDLINHYNDIELDAFVVMPNHVHGIIIVTSVGAIHVGAIPVVGAIHELPLRRQQPTPIHIIRRKMLIPKIIGRFKMQSSKKINDCQNTNGQPFWQSRYYDHIIRNENSLYKIQRYINNNPLKWECDRNNDTNLSAN